jgi:autotransporter-associated beta strand protein
VSLTTSTATVIFSNPFQQTFNGAISGSGRMTKSGAGTLTLTAVNAFSGTTSIAEGRLRLSAGGALPSSSPVTLTNNATAILDLNNQNQTVGPLSGGGGNGGNIVLGVGKLTINQSIAATYAGIISGGGSIEKNGSQTLTFTNSNSFTGSTTVALGTLRLGNGVLRGSVAGNIANNSQVIFANPTSQAYSGNISGSGRLTAAGVGVLALSGTSSFTGGTTIASGTVAARSPRALGAGDVLVAAGSAFEIEATGFTLAALAGAVDGRITLEAGASMGVAGDNTLPMAAGNIGGIVMRGESLATRYAEILSGSLAASSDIAVAWSPRTDPSLASDVLHFTGTGATTWVIQMRYDPLLLPSAESALAAGGLLYVGWKNQGNTWVNAVYGNAGGSIAYVQRAWQPTDGLGTFGIDVSANQAWAVVNHNSEFAIMATVPEPQAVVLAALGAGIAMCFRRLLRQRRRKPVLRYEEDSLEA